MDELFSADELEALNRLIAKCRDAGITHIDIAFMDPVTIMLRGDAPKRTRVVGVGGTFENAMADYQARYNELLPYLEEDLEATLRKLTGADSTA